jgi:hypothetical protein
MFVFFWIHGADSSRRGFGPVEDVAVFSDSVFIARAGESPVCIADRDAGGAWRIDGDEQAYDSVAATTVSEPATAMPWYAKAAVN